MTRLTLLVVAAALILAACSERGASMRREAIRNIQQPKTLAEVQDYARGTWESLSVELRPTEDRTGTGTVTPSYLKRRFSYLGPDAFEGTITLYGDDYGTVPMLSFAFKGELRWGEPHPVAEGAWQVDYVLTDGFAVTPLSEPAAAMLNQAPVEGLAPFEVGVEQDILGKPFPLFNIAEGQVVADYDLIYFRNGMLFMGAKHVDGTPFDTPGRRPHQLQIPLVRVSN